MRTLAGVEFELCGYVLLDGKDTDPAYPALVRNIDIRQHCRALHFLQSCDACTTCPTGMPVGSYTVHYSSGGQETIPMAYGEDVCYWAEPVSKLSRATEAWGGKNDNGQSVRLLKRTWINPHPGLEIRSIDFLTAGPDSTHPILLAITAER